MYNRSIDIKMKTIEKSIKWIFWGIWIVIIAVCSYFIVANAAWVNFDDTQVIMYTGWDKPIFGFFVDPSYGRFFPLDYTVYDILLLFYNGQVPPVAHYAVHVFWFIIFIAFFTAISLHLLKNQKTVWKYAITLFLLVSVIGRTYVHFMQLWTGIWTIISFIPIFLYGYIRFSETKKWGYGILALIAINYILYYYETMFTIPIALGACSLLFTYKKQDKRERVFNYLLIASGITFLLLYLILVVPRIEHMYHHYTEDSLLANALKMLFAQKIMWLVIIVLIVRVVSFFKKNTTYTIYDSILLASCAYFVGASTLHLDYTLYYTPAVILALPALLYFGNQYLKPWWVLILFVCLAGFYSRNIPRDIKWVQKGRKDMYTNICKFNEIVAEGKDVYYYLPDNPALDEGELDIRSCKVHYLESKAGWYQNNPNFSIIRIEECESFVPGLWVMDEKDEQIFIDKCPSAQLTDLLFWGYKLYIVE